MCLDPSSVLFEWFCDDKKLHLGMLYPAELGTLTDVHTGLISLNPIFGCHPWHEIEFSLKFRNPKAVDHIFGVENNAHWLSSRDMDLIGCYDLLVWIAYFPPPLVTDDVDGVLFGNVRC